MTRKSAHHHQTTLNSVPRRLFLSTLSLVVCLYIYFTYKLSRIAVDHPTNEEQVNDLGTSVYNTSVHTSIDTDAISSVDYMACCGAGHRMSKLSEAHYLSKRMGFGLRAYWGYCETYSTRRHQTEVFHYLFGSIALEPYALDNRNLYARINNDVPGFSKLIRDGNCDQCHEDKARTDQVFYASLRESFRGKPAVEAFRREHFDGRNVVGIHIRAGNGEAGDFRGRGRGIEDIETWLQLLKLQVVRAIEREWGSESHNDKVTIFLATDTKSVLERLKIIFKGIPVVHWEQTRPTAGTGVLFGEQGKVTRDGEVCLDGWVDTFMDMMLLSHSDIVMAARPSSFTQSLPMSLAYSNERTFCEVNADASDVRCYRDFVEWCCEGRTAFGLEGIKQKYDYLRMPSPEIMDPVDLDDPDFRRRNKINNRPVNGCTPQPMGKKQVCLPYDWSKFIVRPDPAQRLHPKRRRQTHPRSH